MTIKMPIIAKNIRAIRKHWKLTQKELAGVIRMDQGSVSFWEKGVVHPSGPALVALADIFRTTIHALETQEIVLPDPLPVGGFRGAALPDDGKSYLVDLDTGSMLESPSSKLVLAVAEAERDGRQVWLVVK